MASTDNKQLTQILGIRKLRERSRRSRAVVAKRRMLEAQEDFVSATQHLEDTQVSSKEKLREKARLLATQATNIRELLQYTSESSESIQEIELAATSQRKADESFVAAQDHHLTSERSFLKANRDLMRLTMAVDALDRVESDETLAKYLVEGHPDPELAMAVGRQLNGHVPAEVVDMAVDLPADDLRFIQRMIDAGIEPDWALHIVLNYGSSLSDELSDTDLALIANMTMGSDPLETPDLADYAIYQAINIDDTQGAELNGYLSGDVPITRGQMVEAGVPQDVIDEILPEGVDEARVGATRFSNNYRASVLINLVAFGLALKADFQQLFIDLRALGLDTLFEALDAQEEAAKTRMIGAVTGGVVSIGMGVGQGLALAGTRKSISSLKRSNEGAELEARNKIAAAEAMDPGANRDKALREAQYDYDNLQQNHHEKIRQAWQTNDALMQGLGMTANASNGMLNSLGEYLAIDDQNKSEEWKAYWEFQKQAAMNAQQDGDQAERGAQSASQGLA